ARAAGPLGRGAVRRRARGDRPDGPAPGHPARRAGRLRVRHHRPARLRLRLPTALAHRGTHPRHDPRTVRPGPPGGPRSAGDPCRPPPPSPPPPPGTPPPLFRAHHPPGPPPPPPPKEHVAIAHPPSL